MENKDKLVIMDKILRELEDMTKSQTSILKKIGQLEADNINLGNKFLEKKLSDIYQHVDDSLLEATTLQTEFGEIREKFVTDNKLDEVFYTDES